MELVVLLTLALALTDGLGKAETSSNDPKMERVPYSKVLMGDMGARVG